MAKKTTKKAKKVVRKKPTKPQSKEQNLINSMEKLTTVMKEMVKLFKTANKQMMSGKDPISQRLDDLEEQNQKIAKGVLAVAKLVKQDQQMEPFEHVYDHFEKQTFGPEEAPGQMPIPGPVAHQPRPMPLGGTPRGPPPRGMPAPPRPQPGSVAEAFSGPQLPEFEQPQPEIPIDRLPPHRMKKKPLPPPPNIPPQ